MPSPDETLLSSTALWAPLLAFLLAAGGLYVLLASGLAGRIALDHPNHRSLHAQPVPRIGGIVLVPAALAAWLPLPGEFAFRLAAAGAAVLCLVSYIDDRVGLPAGLRLLCHLAAAAAFVLLIGLAPALALAAVLVIVWCANLYNFMDGADGLAGGMALIGFSCLAFAAMDGAPGLALASACLAAAAAGFLMFNFPPARVFLGDAGSVPLGFLVGALGIMGWQAGLWPAWFPLLVFSPFIVDASVTLLKRVLKRERVWEAHRDHYYQRLVRMGWSHRRLALAEYALMLAAAVAALALHRTAPNVQLAGLIAWAAVLILLMYAVDRRWARYRSASGTTQ